MKKKILCMLLAFTLLLPVVPVSAKAKPKLNKTSVAISKGKTYKLKLKNNKKKVKWSSSNKKIATVSKKGTIKGKSNGYAKITAKVGKKKYTCKVYVGKCLYSNKYISVYYQKTYSGSVQFAVYNKTSKTMYFSMDTLALDSQNFNGYGYESIKSKSVHTVPYDNYEGSSMSKKSHKYLTFSCNYYTSKIDKDLILRNKVIGTKYNNTSKPHTKNVLIDNSKLKVSYDSQTEDGVLFTITNKMNNTASVDCQYLIIENASYKEQDGPILAPKSTGQMLYEGNIRASKITKMSGAFQLNYEYTYSFLDKAISE